MHDDLNHLLLRIRVRIDWDAVIVIKNSFEGINRAKLSIAYLGQQLNA